MSRQLGYEPMPWQAAWWDVQYELNEDGMLWYREADITVPRQSAKTTSTLVRQVDRCLHSEERGWGRRPVAAFTAQHASDARDKMMEVWAPDIEASPEIAAHLGRVNRSNGKEGFSWTNGARIITFPPNMKGAHGSTLDLVDIDEAFAFPDNRAEQGSRPAMITRPSPQIVIQSTAGTAESVYFKRKVDDGRARVKLGEDSHICYLEFSIDPDVDDIHNPDHWWRWMPALGYTQSIDALLMEKEAMDADEFYRAFGNGWTKSGKQIIPAAKWAAAFEPKTARHGKVWMAVDVSPGANGGGRSASISIASFRDNAIDVEVLAHGSGTDWVAEKIGELTRKNTVQSLWLDATGPIGQIVPDIKLKSMAKIEETDARTMANACGRFHQAVLDRSVRHRNQDVLNAAVEGADKRILEDGWAWKRRTSTADISPLVSCTLAHWAACVGRDRGLIGMHTPGSST